MRVGATRLNVKYPIWDPMDIEYYPRVSHPPDLRSQPTAKLKYLYFSTLPEMMLKSMYLNLWWSSIHAYIISRHGQSQGLLYKHRRH